MNLFQSQMKLTLIQGHLSNDLALGSGQPKSDLIQKTWLHSIHRWKGFHLKQNCYSYNKDNLELRFE